jgi:hypothetical protein
MIDVPTLARALGGDVRGNAVLAPGPGHSKSDRSLSVTVDPDAPDGFVVHSFSNDDPLACKDYVRERAGLDSWQPSAPAPNDHFGYDFSKGANHNGDTGIVAEYVYHDAEGQPSRKIGRTAGKQFPQWRWEGERWVSGVKGLPLYPYRLPSIVPPGNDIFICEGEKDADRLAGLGLIATTNPGGAGNWKSDLNRWFEGRVCYVLEDDDDAGRKRVHSIASQLHPIAAEVRIVTFRGIKEGGDVSDWLDLNPGKPLIEYVKGFPVWSPGTSSWPAPSPIVTTLPSVEPFIPELLPEAMRGYVMDVAERQQSAPDFVAVAALCGLSAVVGNRIRIAPKQHDDWEVVPNLWGAIIGRPSAMKSPAMQSALGPIYSLQDQMRDAWQEEVKAAKVDEVLSTLDAKEAKKKAEKAMKGGDRDAARSILADLAKDDEEEPPCPRIVVNDATVEKLGELLNENPRGLLLIRDELPGFLARLESEEYQSERAFYLEAFNGDGRFTYDRIGRGTVHIENCTLSIIGGVQPSRIAPIVRGAITGASNDGLIQRLQMAVWPDDIPSWKWVDRHPSRDAREAYDRAFQQLHALELGSSDHPLVLRFSPAAQDLFREWMEEIQTEARSGKLSSTLESHILKMPKTVASLALLFEMIEGSHFEVGEMSIRRALGWADYLRSHANRLYSSGDTMAEDGARLIIERRRQLPDQFTVRDVQRKAWASLGDRDAVVSAIDILAATNHCREVPAQPGAGGGRPSMAYAWHPSLKQQG